MTVAYIVVRMAPRRFLVFSLWMLAFCPLSNGQAVRCLVDDRAAWIETSDPSYNSGFPEATAVEDCRSACRTTEKLTFAAVTRKNNGGGPNVRCYCINEWRTLNVNTSLCTYTCGRRACGGPSTYSAYSTCPVGFHGVDCATQCSTNCGSAICQLATGHCRAGCNIGNRTIGKCAFEHARLCVPDTGVCVEGCQSGWYTDTCQRQCPTNCRGRTCDRETGRCDNGCNVGFRGEFCNQDCPENCAENTCNKNSGLCDSGCHDGFHGTTCDLRCPENCHQHSCEQNEGACDKGCEDGWFGLSCDRPCPVNCDKSCDANYGICSQCKDGFYGVRCDKPCSTNCNKTVCDSVTGACLFQCLPGFFGDRCNEACPINCQQSTCDFSNGLCTDGCRPGFYGQDCSIQCPGRCLGGHCDLVSGTCDGGCQDGFYGSQHCVAKCPESCQDGVCDIDDGTCVRGCVTGWTGEMCETGSLRSVDDTGRTEPLPVWVWAVLGVLLVAVMATIGVIVWLCWSRRQSKNGGTPQESGGQTRESLDYVNTEAFNLDEGQAEGSVTDDVTPRSTESQMYEKMGERDDKGNMVYDQIDIEVN